ncbi:MAG: transposase, partial [Chloroflexota bacterium]
MPNHFHGIIIIHDVVGATLVVAQNQQAITQPQPAGTRPAPTLGEIIGAFKSITTLAYIRGVDELGWPQF